MTEIPPTWKRPLRGLLVTAAAAALVACGGDGDSASAGSTLSGVAAVGSPIVGGAVNVTCAGGTALDTTTSSTGTWQVALSGQTLPCAVQVQGGSVDGVASTLTLHSVAFDTGNVNITPLTELVFARAVAGNPQAWFASPAFAALTSANVDAAITQILDTLGLTTALAGLNPLASEFQPQAGNAMDDALTALAGALQSLGTDFAALLAAASQNDFAAFAGLPGAVATAQGSGSGGGSSSGTCTSGVEMVYSGTAGGGFTDQQKLCVTASATSLGIAGKTLANPTTNAAVTAPFAGYTFVDGGNSYEVVLKNGAPYEINYSLNGSYLGTLMSTVGLLKIEVSVNGVPTPSFSIPGETPPASQAEFCADPATNPNVAGLGYTLSNISCSFSNNVGTIQATASVGGVGVPFVVTFTWGG